MRFDPSYVPFVICVGLLSAVTTLTPAESRAQLVPKDAPVRKVFSVVESHVAFRFREGLPSAADGARIPWSFTIHNAVKQHWLWLNPNSTAEEGSWRSADPLPDRLSSLSDDALFARYAAQERPFREKMGDTYVSDSFDYQDELGWHHNPAIVHSGLTWTKRAAFYLSTISILTEFSRWSPISHDEKVTELKQFLGRVGTRLTFDEKIELATSYATAEAQLYDDARAAFRTSGLRDFVEISSRLTNATITAGGGTGICGDIALATNQTLIALDPSLKGAVFTISYSSGSDGHVVSIVFDRNAPGRILHVINYDENWNYSGSESAWERISSTSAYRNSGIQLRLFDADGRGLAEIPAARTRYLAALLGDESAKALGIAPGALSDPGMSTITARAGWNRAIPKKQVGTERADDSRVTTIAAGVGSTPGMNFRGASLDFAHGHAGADGSGRDRNLQIASIASDEGDGYGVSTFVANYSQRWTSKDYLNDPRWSLRTGAAVNAGIDVAVMRDGNESGTSVDGWVRGSATVRASHTLADGATVSVSNTTTIAPTVSNVAILAAFVKAPFEVIGSLRPEMNSNETEVTYERRLGNSDNSGAHPSGALVRADAGLLATPFGSVAHVGVGTQVRSTTASVSFQIPSSVGTATPSSLLVGPASDRRLNVMAEQKVERPHATWNFKANASLPIASDGPSYVGGGVSLTPRFGRRAQ